MDPGFILGHYKILSKLGEGGASVVYSAMDLRLNRRVALKMFPKLSATDPKSRDRFEHEARAIAALNHPNIVTIYSIEKEGDLPFITMEQVAGQTLKDRIPDNGLAIADFFDTALPLVEAICAAHDNGIIHRDLKPHNIMIDREGRLKVLDFGLAKFRPDGQREKSGTRSTGVSEDEVEGSVPYMSPEQILGGQVGERSDIFSLGIVLFEMATGKQPFSADTMVEQINSILHETPLPPQQIRSDLPQSLNQIIGVCLKKNPDGRFASASDLRQALKKVQTDLGLANGNKKEKTSIWTRFLKWGVIATVVVVAALMLHSQFKEKPFELGQTRKITHDPGAETYPTLSPDGTQIAYVAGPPGNRDLYFQSVDDESRLNLTQGIDARVLEWPQWSPDGSQLLVSAWGERTRIYTIKIGGGPPVLQLDLAGSYTCATWSPEGTRIAYVHEHEIFIKDLSAVVPDQKVANVLDAHSLCWSKDGTRIACVSGNRQFHSFGNVAPSSLIVVSLENNGVISIIDNGFLNTSPTWQKDSRHLLFLSDMGGTLDIYRVAVDKSGKPKGLASRLTTGLNASDISLTEKGSRLAYCVTAHRANIWSIPIPTAGPVHLNQAQPITHGSQIIEAIDISNDGTWLVYDSNRHGNQELFKQRLPDGNPVRLTKNDVDDFGPAWSPEGDEIAFYSIRTGNRDVFVMSADGTRQTQVTTSANEERYPDWSPDGKTLVYESIDVGTLLLIRRDQKDAPWNNPEQLTFRTGFIRAAQWSPTGDWIAYPTENALHLVSPDGNQSKVLATRPDGSRPLPWTVNWSSDGQTLYFKSYDGKSIPTISDISLSSGEQSLLVDFEVPTPRTVGPDLTSDGKNFYFTLPETEGDIFVMELSSI